ncbi:MAG: hypothetical protein Q8Q09_19180 [Deltaproteobacteria bacterium]|nr:hypothetical protein [Deltaproteobacteria bacterium]
MHTHTGPRQRALLSYRASWLALSCGLALAGCNPPAYEMPTEPPPQQPPPQPSGGERTGLTTATRSPLVVRPSTEAQRVSPETVTLSVFALLVAPGDARGEWWDGTGAFLPDVRRAIQLYSPATRASVLTQFAVSGRYESLASTLPWAIPLWQQVGLSAPDVIVQVQVDGQTVLRAGPYEDSWNPRWLITPSSPVTLGPHTMITVTAVDADVLSSDPIGSCARPGTPRVIPEGYVPGSDWTCHGLLWGIQMFVRPAASGS